MRRQTIVFICILVIGLIFPFIDYLVIIEVFLLIGPLSILFFGAIALFVGGLIWDRSTLRQYILFVLVVPIFVVAQFISDWTVDTIQRYRCELIIKEVEKIAAQTGQIPDGYKVSFGINYVRLNNKSEFKLSYSRGFMVKENYFSQDKTWESQGWKD